MRKIAILLLAMLIAVGTIPSASAVATLTVGSISYDNTIVKDESITVISSITAASVSGTLTVDATLTDNSGMFSVPSPTQQVQFTSAGTKSVSWTVTATSTGTNSAPFTISASGDDGSSTAKTASSALTVKDRPVLTVSSSTDVSSVSAGDNVVISYLVSNSASAGAADATNVKVALSLPSGWSLTSGSTPYTLGTISPAASSAGSWTVTADSPSSTNTFELTVTSTVPGGSVTTSSSVTGPSSSSSSTSSSVGGGGGGGGATGEEYENIALKNVEKVYVQKDVQSMYYFSDEQNPITTIRFMPIVNAGYTDVTVEVLHDTSALVDSAPEGKVYRNMNIWVGKSGWASSSTISDPQISFAVEKSWINENNVDAANIRLMRYTTQWDELETKVTEEDDDYVYFTASTPGFSPFAITVLEEAVNSESDSGDIEGNIATDESTIATEEAEETTEESSGIPGFEAMTLVSMIGLTFLIKRIKE